MMIERNLHILKKGDHIEMPLENRCFGTFLKHHAIVENFNTENKKLDVEGLMGKQMEIKAEECDRKLEDITLIEYRNRRYDHVESYARADKVRKDYESSMNDIRRKTYSIFNRNCEHFAAACVNGKDKELSFENFDKSTSMQSAKCFWVLFDIITAILQCLFFIMNFYIFAIFVNGKDKEHFHYANMSVQYTAIFDDCKNDNFQMKIFDIFPFFCSKHRLWVHVRTASVRRF